MAATSPPSAPVLLADNALTAVIAAESAALTLHPSLDVDASITATKYDALTDGLLAIRYSPDSASASRFLSVFTTAKATVKNLIIFYTPGDTSGTACGCSATDCRVTSGAEVQQ